MERQWRQRMAGTRTNSLVAVGAAAFVMAGIMGTADQSNVARIVGQVVSGVGFLGAGVIFKTGANISGLNTAATIWSSAAVGTLAGLGYPLFALITAGSVIVINTSLRPLAYRLHPAVPDAHYHFDLTCLARDESHVRALLLHHASGLPLSLVSIHTEPRVRSERVIVISHFRAIGRDDESVEQLVGRLSLEHEISSVTWHAMRVTESTGRRKAA